MRSWLFSLNFRTTGAVERKELYEREEARPTRPPASRDQAPAKPRAASARSMASSPGGRTLPVRSARPIAPARTERAGSHDLGRDPPAGHGRRSATAAPHASSTASKRLERRPGTKYWWISSLIPKRNVNARASFPVRDRSPALSPRRSSARDTQ